MPLGTRVAMPTPIKRAPSALGSASAPRGVVALSRRASRPSRASVRSAAAIQIVTYKFSVTGKPINPRTPIATPDRNRKRVNALTNRTRWLRVRPYSLSSDAVIEVEVMLPPRVGIQRVAGLVRYHHTTDCPNEVKPTSGRGLSVSFPFSCLFLEVGA